MGLDNSAAMFLSAAKSLGVDFARTAMIGRQSFWPDADVLRSVFAAQGITLDADAFLREDQYSERFLELLGAREIVSVDYSPYEHATRLHDMNQPIPADWRERHSVVYDGGTIEHVFNIPQAFKNCMEMVEVGGHFLQVNIANNFVGHGFWQFSPELIFRMFSAANGFQIVGVLMTEVVPHGRWYRVADPQAMGARVELCNRRPTYILTIARRTDRKEIFATPPLQSDYRPMWTGNSGDVSQPRPRAWKDLVPNSFKRPLKPVFNRLSWFGQGWSRSCYRRLDEQAVLSGRL
ncbi:MAG: hypothetical protein SH850_13545 [Planctomycetaceae bacterium]|nr:hypothetical protein [Planctomycetaceae bacterium]